MDAKCPKCFGKNPDCTSCSGSGFVVVKIAEGVWYSRDCLDCKMHIGVCIVGEQGASIEYVQQHPENLVCPFCDGQAAYSTEEEPDDEMLYRLPLEHEPPNGKSLVRKIKSERLNRRRRCLCNRMKTNKRKVIRIRKILEG